MKLSIIIPVYNNWNFTKTCLKDLAKLPIDHEVILIDNGSEDTTRKSTTLWTKIIAVDQIHPDHPSTPGLDRPANLVCKRNETNLGFARSCNQGFMLADGDYVLFLNNDIKVKSNFEDWTQVLIQKAEETNGLVGPTGGVLDDKLGFVKETNQKIDGNFYMSGWCLCAKRDVFKQLILDDNEFKGPFNELFISYFEDTDLSFRAEEQGIPMEIVDVPVFHFGRMTGKKVGLAELYHNSKQKFVNKWSQRIK